MLLEILIITAWGISIIYLFWILFLNYGWVSIPSSSLVQQESQLKISVIIAIRNEERNLPKLLNSLKNQSYPSNQYEIIIIDDHSDDNSNEIIRDFKSNNVQINFRYFQLQEDSGITGKKAALQLGYAKTNNPIILLTDGDCIVDSEWINLTANAFQDKAIKMVLGGVIINKPEKLSQKFQSLELLSLIGSGAGAANLSHPIMSNGANLSFRTEILDNIDFKQLKPNMPSGDDVFLMMETKNIFGPQAIRFLKDPQHFVFTSAEKNWKTLINQRIRWVSKSSRYTDAFLLSTSLVVLLQNFILLVLLTASFFYSSLGFTLLNIWVLKIAVDFLFLRKICSFTSQTKLLKHYPVLAFVYPFFISYTAIIGQFAGFSWKGRKY